MRNLGISGTTPHLTKAYFAKRTGLPDPIWLRPNVAAYAAQVEVRTLAAWSRAGEITRKENGNYDWREIEAYIANWPPERLAKVESGRKRRGETRRKADVAGATESP